MLSSGRGGCFTTGGQVLQELVPSRELAPPQKEQQEAKMYNCPLRAVMRGVGLETFLK